jgi:hypothetical protein
MNNYKRDILQIPYWCVTINNITEIYNFFNKRLDKPSIFIECDYKSGNNKICTNLNQFVDLVSERQKNIDNLVSLKIQFTEGNELEKKYKDLFLRVNFFDNYSEFEVRAGDFDNSLKDWVAGTYEEMLRIKNKFEMEEKYQKCFLDKVINKNSLLKYYSIFDPFGEIKKGIIEESKIKPNSVDGVVHYAPVITINGDNNFSDIKDSLNIHNKNDDNIEKWYHKPLGQIILMITGGLILGFFLYKFGWN